MTPHPDFASLDIPQALAFGRFRMEMLTAEDLAEDYAAVMSSVPVLQGVFDAVWPEGLTLAANETDLHWHHREFTARRSFAWAIRTEAEGYVGCAYLFADIGTTGAGEAVYWMIDTPERLDRLEDFGAMYVAWLNTVLPPGYDLRVVTNG